MRKFKMFIGLSVLALSQMTFAQSESQKEQELPEGVIAQRGDGVLTRHVFDARMERIPAKDRAAVLRSSERTQTIMADLLLTSQLKAHAVNAGFDKGDIQYRMQLAADTELANAWLKHYVDSKPDADYEALAREYYLLNKDKIVTTPSIDVTHLLVQKKNRTKEQLDSEAQAYLDRILADPTIFDELVLSHSEDPSVHTNQGRFIDVKKGDMVPEFEQAAFALENPGDFAELVESAYGIHIIRLDKKTPSRTLSFEEVKDRLVAQQEQKYREQLRYSYLNELGSEPWAVSEKELELLVDRYTDRESALKASGNQDTE